MLANPQEYNLVQTLSGHTAPVLSLVFTKNGRFVLSTSQDKSVRLWNPHEAVHIKTYTGPHNYEVNDAAVSDDNARFVSCGGDKDFFLWDVTSGQVIRKFVGHERKVNALAFSPNQEVVLSASHDKAVRIWDMRARSRGSIQALTEATDSVLCLSAQGDEIVTGSADGCVRQYDVRKGQMVVDSLLQPVGSVSFSNDGECILVSTLDHSIRLLEHGSGQQLAHYHGHKNSKYKIRSTLDPADCVAVSGSEDNCICMWDLVDANLVCSLTGHTGPVLSVRFFEGTLVSAGADSTVRVWKAPSGPSATADFDTAGQLGIPAAFGAPSKKVGHAHGAAEDGATRAAGGAARRRPEQPRRQGDRGRGHQKGGKRRRSRS